MIMITVEESFILFAYDCVYNILCKFAPLHVPISIYIDILKELD